MSNWGWVSRGPLRNQFEPTSELQDPNGLKLGVLFPDLKPSLVKSCSWGIHYFPSTFVLLHCWGQINLAEVVIRSGYPGGSVVKNSPAVQEMQKIWVQSLGWKEMATHSSIPTWRIPWTEQPGRLVNGDARVGHAWVTKPPPASQVLKGKPEIHMETFHRGRRWAPGVPKWYGRSQPQPIQTRKRLSDPCFWESILIDL